MIMDLEGNTGHTFEYGEETRFKRSSILKPSKPRLPLQDVNLGLSDEDTTEVRRRRVSFGVKKIKQFNTEADTYSICVAPEEEVHHSASSESSFSITAGGEQDLILGKSINGRLSVRARQSQGANPNSSAQHDTENIPAVVTNLRYGIKCNGGAAEPVSLDMTCPVNNNLSYEVEITNGQEMGKNTDANDVSQMSMELTMAYPQYQLDHHDYSNMTKMSGSMSIASSCGARLDNDEVSDDSCGKRAYERSSFCSLDCSMDLTDVVSSPPTKKFHQSFSPYKPFPDNSYCRGKGTNNCKMGETLVLTASTDSENISLPVPCDPPEVLMPVPVGPSFPPSHNFSVGPQSLPIGSDHLTSPICEVEIESDKNSSDGIPDRVPDDSQLDETCQNMQALTEDLAPFNDRNLDDMCETSIVNPVTFENNSRPVELGLLAPVNASETSIIADVEEPKLTNSSGIDETSMIATAYANTGNGHLSGKILAQDAPTAVTESSASPVESSIEKHRKSCIEGLTETCVAPFSLYLSMDPLQPVPVEPLVQDKSVSAPNNVAGTAFGSHLAGNNKICLERSSAQFPLAEDEDNSSDGIPDAVPVDSVLEGTCENVQASSCTPLDGTNLTDMCETSVVNPETFQKGLTCLEKLSLAESCEEPAVGTCKSLSTEPVTHPTDNDSFGTEANQSHSFNSQEENLEIQSEKLNTPTQGELSCRVESLNLGEVPEYSNGLSSICPKDSTHSQPVIIDSSSKVTGMGSSPYQDVREDSSCVVEEIAGSENTSHTPAIETKLVEIEPVATITGELAQTSISESRCLELSILDSCSEVLRDSPFQKSFEIPNRTSPRLSLDSEMMTTEAFPLLSLTASRMELITNEEPRDVQHQHPTSGQSMNFVRHICTFMARHNCNYSEDTGDVYTFEYRSCRGALLLNFKFAYSCITDKTPVIKSYMSLGKRATAVNRHCASFLLKQISQKWLDENFKVIGHVFKVQDMIKKKINSISTFYKSLSHFLRGYKCEIVNDRLNFTFSEYHSITRFHVSIDISSCNLNNLKVHITPDFGEVSEAVIQVMINDIFKTDETFHNFFEFMTRFYINKFKEQKKKENI